MCSTAAGQAEKPKCQEFDRVIEAAGEEADDGDEDRDAWGGASLFRHTEELPRGQCGECRGCQHDEPSRTEKNECEDEWDKDYSGGNAFSLSTLRIHR